MITLIQWIGIFVTNFTAVVLNLLYGLFFFTAVAGYIIGICEGSKVGQMLCVAFVVFTIPYVTEWLIMRAATVNIYLIDFFQS